MKILKNKDLDKCLKIIIKHCDDDCIWSDESLIEFCKKPKHVQILYALKHKNYIDLLDSNCSIEAVSLFDEGQYYFLNKETSRKDKLFTFFHSVCNWFPFRCCSGCTKYAFSTIYWKTIALLQ